MKNIISILIITILLVSSFQSVHASDTSEKIKFCTTISDISKSVMILRQLDIPKDDAMTLTILRMDDLGLEDSEEAQDMAKLFVSTAYSFPVTDPPLNEMLINIMGDVVLDNCIEELVEENNFL